ncbi:oxalate:formate antiporter [Elysia marginata]|uniref:Oxalate:formate antiporter n=1 Tax=Elysia marginata TaxID=1093978 RepID=A0AAV4F9G4_9GAST|nr:oxalate:formate antiporter [Elysia marginata]
MKFRTEKIAKILSLIGVHFMTAPASFLWNYGNLSAYMESYFRMYCYPHCVDGDSQWIINLYSACFCPGLCLSGPICKYLGFRWSGILAMITCNIGIISSAWIMRESVIGTAIMIGLLNGIGMGMSLCTAFMYVNAWAGKNKGLFVASVTSAPTILSILQNQIITEYVNPNNLKPDVQIGPRTYFSELSLLKRVPNVVFILGLMTLVLQLIGNAMVSTPHESPPNAGEKSDNKGPNKPHSENSNGHALDSTASSLSDTEKTVIIDNESSNYLSTEGAEQNSHTTPLEGNAPDEKTILKCGEHKSKEFKADTLLKSPPRSLKPLEAIKTGSFKALWLFVVALMYGLILKNNYYKQFGLIYIEDDRFLTLVGSLIPVTASIARITFGSLLDMKIISVKDCIVITLSLNSVLCAFWFFLPQVSSIAYMFLILALASMHSVTYTLAATGSLLLYGPDYFAINFAMVYTAATVLSIVTAFTVTPLLQALGWFWLFTSCGIVSAMALTFAVLITMDEKRPEF